MKLTGKDIIDKLSMRLKEKNIRCYDSAIINLFGSLNWRQINELCMLGDVASWRNDRIEAERLKKTGLV